MIKWVVYCKESHEFVSNGNLVRTLDKADLFNTRDEAREAKEPCDVVKKVKVTVELA